MTILAVLVLLLAGIHLAQRAVHLAQAVLATFRRPVVALSVALALIYGRPVLSRTRKWLRVPWWCSWRLSPVSPDSSTSPALADPASPDSPTHGPIPVSQREAAPCRKP